jgi:hypothetical protein
MSQHPDRTEGGTVPWVVWAFIIALALVAFGWIFRVPW